MNRREFLLSGALGAILSPSSTARAQTPNFDRFGGLRTVRFDANGYFRLERRDRWWFVTPDGHGWLGLGMNHVHPAWLNQPYNADVWRERFGAQRFNDAAWRASLTALIKRQISECGYNHFGVHNDFDTVGKLAIPQIRTVSFVKIAHSFVCAEADFPDVFDDSFARHCDALAAQQCAPERENPFVVGWAFTDCPILTEAESAARPVVAHGSPRDACPTWPRVLRNLPAAAPGKQAWLQVVRRRYADNLNAFNDCYGVSFATWGELSAAERWRELTDLANPRELADNQAFLEQVVERYCAVACTAIRRHAPHHLIFGDKLNGNTDGVDAVVKVSSRHTDLVFYQMYARWEQQRQSLDRWKALSSKPTFNGDGTFSTPNEMMPNPHGPHARDQAERGDWAVEFGQNAFARPDFVGWTVCGWVDTWRSMPRKQFKQHSGFYSALGEPHSAYIGRLREFAGRLYDVAKP